MVRGYFKRKGMPKCSKGIPKKKTYIKSNTRSSMEKSRTNTRQNSENIDKARNEA